MPPLPASQPRNITLRLIKQQLQFAQVAADQKNYFMVKEFVEAAVGLLDTIDIQLDRNYPPEILPEIVEISATMQQLCRVLSRQLNLDLGKVQN